MRKRILSMVVTMCMLLAFLPFKVQAISIILMVGQTVFDVGSSVDEMGIGPEISYWKEADSNDDTFVEADEADYDFSATYDSESDSITLILKNIDISGGDIGILYHKSLNIILEGTANSIEVSGEGITAENVALSGNGALNITQTRPDGDAIYAFSDIRIFGNVQIKLIDWSEGHYKCGLHSENGSVAIGGNANVDICSQSIGIYSENDVHIGYVWDDVSSEYIASGNPTVKINDENSIRNAGDGFVAGEGGIVSREGDISISGGEVYVCAGLCGLYTMGGNVEISGSSTTLSINVDMPSLLCGIKAENSTYDKSAPSQPKGMVCISDATVNITQDSEAGDAIYAQSDIRIFGNAQVILVDWGELQYRCGLRSDTVVAIGGNANVDICSQSIGIYSENNVYIGYVWDDISSEYIASGNPTVKINDEESIQRAENDAGADFTAGPVGVIAYGDVEIDGNNTLINIYVDSEQSHDNLHFGLGSENIVNISGATVNITQNSNLGLAILSYNIVLGGDINVFSEGYGVGVAGDIEINKGSLIAAGGNSAFYFYPTEGTGENGLVHMNLNMPHRYRTNTEAVPDGDYTYDTDSVYEISDSVKYYEVSATYNITKAVPENGNFDLAINNDAVNLIENNDGTIPAAAGDEVSLDASPDGGYILSGWSVTYGDAYEVAVSTNVFIMPGNDVTIEAIFDKEASPEPNPSPIPSVPSKTIAVTETSSSLFINSKGAIRAEANMENAFSESVEVKVTDTQVDGADFGLSIGSKVYPFDISLYEKGTNIKTQPEKGYAVTIFLPVPDELLDVKEKLSVMHKSDDGVVSELFTQLTQIDGIWYLVFEATEFSPYALVVNDAHTYDETAGVPYYFDIQGNKVFIGFAAGGRYLAPSDATVLTEPNIKNFSDADGHWAEEHIKFVTEREIFDGTDTGKYSPDTGLNRAMFAAVIGRLYERSFGAIETSNTNTFSDCDYEAWYGKYVDWAADAGIIEGYGDDKFGPSKLITREQMATLLYRFAEYLGALPVDVDEALMYTDASDISDWAKSAALYCQTSQIITGRSGGIFAPKETVTRAEAATIIQRFVNSVLK